MRTDAVRCVCVCGRAYLQERSLARRRLVGKGRSAPGSQDLLFFGCRTQESDFLYRCVCLSCVSVSWPSPSGPVRPVQVE